MGRLPDGRAARKEVITVRLTKGLKKQAEKKAGNLSEYVRGLIEKDLKEGKELDRSEELRL